MQLSLEGQILTPIVTKRTFFHLMGCQFRILRPRRRYYTKITVGKPMYPYSFICYLGSLQVTYSCKTKTQAKRKLISLLKIESIGRFSSEGMGKIQWETGRIRQNRCFFQRKRYSKIRIRQGLPQYLPPLALRLIRYGLLHDFVHTSRHPSKIYVEPQVKEVDLLRRHHDLTDDPFIRRFQQYDRLASRITRRIKSPRQNRYNWQSNQTLDFEKLATEITEVANKSVWKLYHYIYESTELAQLTESLQFGHTSLRYHLLLIANLIVRDFQPRGS
ncbi:MAG: hypothetical protein ACFFFG_15190 [Candidatus Thorarchaeota archaeon]